MPKKLEDCVKSLMKQGYTQSSAYAICTASIKPKKDGKKKK